jgi:hypothetical protein
MTDVQITADQRSQQHKQRCTRAKTEFRIGKMQDLQLNQDNEKNEKPNVSRKNGRARGTY